MMLSKREIQVETKVNPIDTYRYTHGDFEFRNDLYGVEVRHIPTGRKVNIICEITSLEEFSSIVESLINQKIRLLRV